MNTIFWKGVFSTTIEGLLISELPPISKPPMRVKETMIDGRDGSIIEELGYSSYDKSITIGLRGNFNINKVIKYFTGEGEIIFSNEPDKVYTAKVISQIDYNRLLRFRTAVVQFRVQPYKYKHNEAYKEAQTATESGTSIIATNKEDDILKTVCIYGKSTQDGTPTPDAPVDIVSLCEDGRIFVTVQKSELSFTSVDLIVANKLRGIPVTNKSLATYTDESGKMWCADEIDLVRGVHIQRCYAETVKMQLQAENNRYIGTTSKKANTKCGTNNGIIVLCEELAYHGDAGIVGSQTNGVRISSYDGVTLVAYYKGQAFTTLSVVYPLETPIETALTDEEIAACKSVLDFTQGASITNDENAYMKVEYFKPFEVFNEGLEDSRPKMVLRGSGTVEVSVNGVHIFDYTFPEGETEVVIDSEKEDAYLGEVLKNRNMNGDFPILLPGTNKIEWSGYVESIEILPRSRWL